MSRRQYRLTCEGSAHANNSRTATLCFTSCNLLNVSFASHTVDRLRLIELQPMRLMHHKNVCTLVTPIGETEPLQTQMNVFKAVFFLFMFGVTKIYMFGRPETLSTTSCFSSFISTSTPTEHLSLPLLPPPSFRLRRHSR